MLMNRPLIAELHTVNYSRALMSRDTARPRLVLIQTSPLLLMSSFHCTTVNKTSTRNIFITTASSSPSGLFQILNGVSEETVGPVWSWLHRFMADVTLVLQSSAPSEWSICREVHLRNIHDLSTEHLSTTADTTSL
uniref:Uncharacterized protein n=1 Tax=Knipowitschia caucasica TaxID=637954 RepID=A0AAV2MQL7_KNICA